MLVVIALLTAASAPSVVAHLRALSLLLRVSGSTGALAHLFDTPIVEENVLLRSEHGTFRARVYRPRDGRARRAIVLAHGVHYMGIDEPRLLPFARNMARTGVVVMTPELAGLADYQVLPSSTREIEVSAQWLARRPYVASARVALMGLSFAGGLVLMAATDPTTRAVVSGVVSLGGHNDLFRVTRFLATDELQTPEGLLRMRAHDYGLVVFFYAHAEQFVSGEQLPLFRDALRFILHVQRPHALHAARTLDATTRALFDAVERNDKPTLAPLVMRALDHVRAHALAVSPHGRLGALRDLAVVILHGAADDVMPPTEARANARELGARNDVTLVVSPALKHVTVEGAPTAWQQWQLLHAMARVMAM